MLNIVTLLWHANALSRDFSCCYDESWVMKLFDGFARNLTRPHRFVLFTDRRRDLGGRDVLQILIDSAPPAYGACIEPYRLDEPMILVGLDTVVTGNIDHLADYCLNSNTIALPRDPFHSTTVCNGVALVPAGQRKVYETWSGENDMDWMRAQPHKVIDILFPGHVVSFKGDAKHHGLRDARIVYFHGHEKPHELPDVEWIETHWRVEGETVASEIPAGFVSSEIQQIQALPNTSDEILFRHIEINSRRPLPWLKGNPAHTGIAVLVGGGPSLKSHVPFIKGHSDARHTVFALNNAARFLNERGVTADYQVIIDPRPENLEFVRTFSAHRYILASQCHPSLFEHLAFRDVDVLHTASDGLVDHIPPGTTADLIGGGTTSGLVAISMAYALGYREIHLYGYDSSDADDGQAHAYPQDENDPEKRRIKVICAGRHFRSSYAMYVQAQKFEKLARLLADADAILFVHGDGLLPTIAHEMSKGESNGLQAG
jgi:uncharacterized Rossmann fold enzyme